MNEFLLLMKQELMVTFIIFVLLFTKLGKEETKNENDKQIRREYSYRSFKRSFTLDEKIDASGIEAKYVNCVLTLNLPKKEVVKASAQEITIQ